MASTVVLTDVIHHPQGHVEVRWNDSTGQSFPDIATLRQQVQKYDLDVDLTKAICLAWAVARSNDLSNVAQIKNKSFIFDLAAASPIKVQ